MRKLFLGSITAPVGLRRRRAWAGEQQEQASWLGTDGTAGTLRTVGTVEQLVIVLTQPVSLVTVLEASGSQAWRDGSGALTALHSA